MNFIKDPETGVYSSDQADFTVNIVGVMRDGAYRFLVNFKGIDMGFAAYRNFKEIKPGDPEKKIFPTYEYSWLLEVFELPRDPERMKRINCNYKKDFLERMLIFLWTFNGTNRPEAGIVKDVVISERINHWLNVDHKNKYYKD